MVKIRNMTAFVPRGSHTLCLYTVPPESVLQTGHGTWSKGISGSCLSWDACQVVCALPELQLHYNSVTPAETGQGAEDSPDRGISPSSCH